jgi:glucuronate isomerase
MRANGIDEKLITGCTIGNTPANGNATGSAAPGGQQAGGIDPYDRFLAWAETVPRLLGNPLYHWTHLELQRYFDIYEPLNPKSANAIWEAANKKLQNDDSLSVHGIFKKFNVHTIGTTDDPADSLEWHEQIKSAGKTQTRVLPSFRPDPALDIEKPGFAEYIARLGKAAGKTISNLDDLLAVLRDRVAFFDKHGCRAADHGLETMPFRTASGGLAGGSAGGSTGGSAGALWEKEVSATFAKALSGAKPDKTAEESYKTFLLNFLAKEYRARDWALQLHFGALRSVNSRTLKALGPNTGYDVIHDLLIAGKLAKFFDLLETEGKTPKTILYSLNIKDLYPLATVMGSFQGDGIPGKMQLGSAWWFLDHKDGMETQMRILGNTGILSRFVGMLTDSRSFLSYPRHEYFRRILCKIVGNWADNGEIPGDFDLLSGMVRDISFRNAERYFG